MPELRKDPVTSRWVITATGRGKKPSDFIRQPVPRPTPGASCPVCPGREHYTPPEILANRVDSEPNGPGWRLRVIPNKFPVLDAHGALDRRGEGLFETMNGIGAHELIIESPEHAVSFEELSDEQALSVLLAMRDRLVQLKKDQRFSYIVIFKDHGEAAGASMDHSYSQLIALPVVPKHIREELDGARNYFSSDDCCIYCNLLRQEVSSGLRLVSETKTYVILTPYAACFPFEMWLIPKRHSSHFERSGEYQDIAIGLKFALAKLNAILEFPAYNFAVHTAPIQEGSLAYYHWHIVIRPKLTRETAFDWATGFFINPTPPEEAASFLRNAPPNPSLSGESLTGPVE